MATAYVMTPAMLAEAAALRRGGGDAVDDAVLAGKPIPKTVMIDKDVDQKYVLMEIKASKPLFFVRGRIGAQFHKDAALPLIDELKSLGLPYEVLGGGRIAHDSKTKKIRVYHVSHGFPWENGVSRADITAALLRAEFPGYDVTHEDH